MELDSSKVQYFRNVFPLSPPPPLLPPLLSVIIIIHHTRSEQQMHLRKVYCSSTPQQEQPLPRVALPLFVYVFATDFLL